MYFPPISHESISHSRGYKHTPSIVGETGRVYQRCVTPAPPPAPSPCRSAVSSSLREPAVDRRQQRVGLGALALLLPEATEAHGGPELQRFASWRRATSRARCNQVSASAGCGTGCRRSTTPRRRQTSASQQRSSCCSTRVGLGQRLEAVVRGPCGQRCPPAQCVSRGRTAAPWAAWP